MPEIKIRRRLARRSGDWRYRIRRWAYNRRSTLVIAAAFLVAVVFGCLAFTSAMNLGSGTGDDSASDSTGG